MKRSSPKCCSFMVCLTVVLREIVTIVAITCTSRLSHPTSSYDDKRVGYNISPEEVWDARKGFRYVWDLYKGRHLTQVREEDIVIISVQISTSFFSIYAPNMLMSYFFYYIYLEEVMNPICTIPYVY